MSLDGIESILSQNVVKGKKVLNIETSNFLEFGENFGGELLKLDITTEDESRKLKEVLYVIGKKIPVMEIYQDAFNVQQTFKSEIAFYEKLIPLFQEFQRENNVHNVIDCFGKFYGSRLNLDGSDDVDRDGIILLENLAVSGYKNLQRYVGYSSEEARTLLKDLATLHAVPLAIKLKKLDVFKKAIRPLLTNEFEIKESNPFLQAGPLLEDILLESDSCAPLIPKVIKVWNTYKPQPEYVRREPFATFCHGDLWVNNAMMKHENGRPVSNKFVDFQNYDYKSPAVDILNFLITSVQTEVLKKEFNNLLNVYHSEFVRNLEELGCDVTPFSYLNFMEELSQDAPRVFVWGMVFLMFIVFGSKDDPPPNPGSELDLTNRNLRDRLLKSISSKAKERIYIIVDIFAKNNWL